ncbi:protein S100-A12-like [Sceloporus undulatus]|uniref:protein S100-A12-like n=1 Tax=Sceloporus undulatus TaxID=8520 RepID=UPI001C4AC7FF|nr:protein S100-A12-like [Sceloporus undulatus]
MSQTQMERALEDIINKFHAFSVRVGHFDTLTQKELSQLIHRELPNWLKDQKNPKAIEELFKKLDQNKDKQLSFGEFMVFICQVAIATHEHIHHEHPHDHDHDHKHGH